MIIGYHIRMKPQKTKQNKKIKKNQKMNENADDMTIC